MEHGHSIQEIRARLDARGTSARLRDGIFGGIDGTVTTFAIVAGVQGAGLSAGVVVALGLANVIADGFSMAAGNYAGTKAVVDDRKRLRQVEKRHIANNPEGEIAELREILARKGLHGDVLEQATEMISQDQDAWIGMMLAEEYDLPEAEEQPLSAAIVIFVAFVLAGLLPIMPYLINMSDPFYWACWAAAATFFGIGAIKARWSLTSWWWSGLETLAIGGVAAVLSFAVGSLFHP